jgi:hypothetical protein
MGRPHGERCMGRPLDRSCVEEKGAHGKNEVRLCAGTNLPLEIQWSRACLFRELKLLGALSKSIRSIKCRLFTKIITRMDRELRDQSIKSN